MYKDECDMLFEFVCVVREIKLCFLLMENVVGFIILWNFFYLESKLDELREFGYEVNFRLLNFVDYGVV